MVVGVAACHAGGQARSVDETGHGYADGIWERVDVVVVDCLTTTAPTVNPNAGRNWIIGSLL
jgi:hypothetical protein